MNFMEESSVTTHETYATKTSHDEDFEIDLGGDHTDFNPDGPEYTAADMDDTCFSAFSEMPGLDMTKFAFLKQSPAKGGQPDVRSPVPTFNDLQN